MPTKIRPFIEFLRPIKQARCSLKSPMRIIKRPITIKDVMKVRKPLSMPKYLIQN